MIRLLGFLLLLSPSWLTFAGEIPDFNANYLVKLNGLQAGELKRSLTTHDDGVREFTSITQAKGVFAFFKPDIVEESSQWKLVDQYVQPLHYLYKRTGGKKEKSLSVTFNWTDLSAYIDDKKHPWALKIEPKTLDKLVYQISLMRDLQHQKSQVQYRIADGGKLKTYDIIVLGEEEITTPMGKINTVKITRERKDSKERQTILWCAPELHFLPIKLEHHENDTRFTAILRRLKGMDTTDKFTPTKTENPNQTIGPK